MSPPTKNMFLIRCIFLQLTICFKLTLSAPHFRSSTTSLPGITIIPSPTTGETRSQERQPWLVFTSAGDHSAVGQWLAGRHYDIMTVYYGKEPQAFPYRDLVDIYRARQGCKFCNLKYYHETEPELFAKYRYGSVVLPNWGMCCSSPLLVLVLVLLHLLFYSCSNAPKRHSNNTSPSSPIQLFFEVLSWSWMTTYKWHPMD